MSRTFIAFSFMLMFLSFAFVAAAQENAGKSTMPSPSQTELKMPNVNKVAAPVYVSTKLDNLARAYWLYGLLDLKSDSDIDGFLRITECKLFKEFYTQEFEWHRIRSMSRDYILKYRGQFPRRFEYVQPLKLDRYDFKTQSFPLMPDYQFLGAKRFQISDNRSFETECISLNENGRIKGYPLEALLSVDRPFSLTFVRVDSVVAQEYLRLLKDEKIDTSEGRPAYIRFQLKVEKVLGAKDIQNLGRAVEFYGELERYEIFADKELIYKLYEYKF